MPTVRSCRHSLIVRLAASAALATAFVPLSARAQTPSPSPTAPVFTHGLLLSAIDRSVNPLEDFDKYANGAWRSADIIPADKSSTGVIDEVYETNIALLHQILEKLAQDTKATGDDRKLGALYASGMDEARANKAGLTAIRRELALIDAIRSPRDLTHAIALLHREDINPGWSFYVSSDDKNADITVAHLYQGGLGLPDRDYYFKSDKDTKAIREKYVAHVTAIFALAGATPKAAAANAQTVMRLETRLAKASMTIVEQRDPNALYNKYDLAGLDRIAPRVRFPSYFAALGLKSPGVLIVGQPKYFHELSAMFTDVPLADWKTYLRWQTIRSAAPYLNDAIDNENFAFYARTLDGVQQQRPRWKRVQATCDSLMGDALGRSYVAVAFPPVAKAHALQIVDNIRAVLRDRLATSPWMSEATRKKALQKVDALRAKIGYPDKWRSYASLDIRRDAPYWVNVRAGNEFEFERDLRKVGKPLDRSEWSMTPPTVNAYYDPNFNDINFPAGILQPPNYDFSYDDAVNYGNTGATVGHEITHGFDDQGRLYDAHGNLHDWWTPADAKAYKLRSDEVVKQYDAYAIPDGTHVVGKQTLGENIADIGGLKLAWLAYHRSLQGKPVPAPIDGFTAEQRFFLAYAQSWRTHDRPEAIKLRINTDVHSPDRFRVLGPVVNMPEFFAAWGGGKPVGAMAVAPIPADAIW